MASVELKQNPTPVVLATSSVKGIASFNATDFTVTGGAVSLGSHPDIVGGLSIQLAADDNITIDASTNQRTITLGAFRINHTPAVAGTIPFNIVVNANGFGDTHAVNVDYNATGIGAGEQCHLYDIHVDTANSTGGEVQGFTMAKTGTGTASITLAEAYPGVNVLRHRSGTETAIEQAYSYNGAYTDITANLSSAASDVQLFVANGDIVYIGNAAKFNSLAVVLVTVASGAGVKPTFEYWSGAAWTAFTPTDGTTGFRANGTIAWDITLSGWATTAVNGVTKYWIRITRTQNTIATPPTEDTIFYVTSTDYSWDKNGDVDVKSITADTASFGGSTHYSSFEADGTLVFNGNATVFEDWNFDLTPLQSGGTAPGFVNVASTGIRLRSFAAGEDVDGCEEIPHKYKLASNMTPHIHFTLDTIPTGIDNVKYELTYAIINENDTASTATTIDTGDIPIDTQWKMYKANFPTISNASMEGQFLFKVKRVAAVGDAYAGENPVYTFGIHFESDTLGSRQIGTK